MTSMFLTVLLAATTVGSTAPAGPPEGVFDPPPSIRHQLEEAASKRAAFEAFQRQRGSDAKSWAENQPPLAYDVDSYEIDVNVDPQRRLLSGSVTVALESLADGLSVIELDADLGLRILSVVELPTGPFAYDTPTAVAFEHTDDVLRITPSRPLAAGDHVTLQITYGGRASRAGLIGSTGVNWYSSGGTPVIHTFAQPYGARVWWPCQDRPDDKAIVSLRVTVPDDLDVASNGLEIARVDNGDGTATSRWSSRYPVPTYLVVMHISDFTYSEDTYTALDGTTTMPVGLWAMPGVAAQAEADLAVCVPQIEVMASRWGEYPFLDEKYGNATVFFGGGMEHQTMTTLAVNYVGDPWMEWLNVHELGHQWWGDWVTMNDWRDIWLNEGFATHTEWLWAEHQGPDVLADYLVDDDWRGWFSGPVYDNEEPFSWTIYAKGSWVVRMLRHVIGDDTFFSAMSAYRAAHAGGTATTDDLQEAMETASGMELDWFFDEWVYGLYRPRYVYDWHNVSGPAVELTVRQVQTNTGLFRMPMDVRVTTAAGVVDHRVWFEAEAEQTLTIDLDADAVAVEIDPETEVLAEIAHVSEPDLELGPDFPDGYDFGLIVGSGQATKTLPLTNTGGADLVVDGVFTQTGVAFAIANPPAFPLTLAPGATEELEIVFDPPGRGRHSDTLYIQSNDPDRDGTAYLYLYGTGALYDDALLVVPSSLSLGRVAVGGVTEAGFDAVNLGGQPLAIQTTIEGDGFLPAITVPPVLPPASSTEVRVRFQPTAVGDAAGTVIFHTGDPTNPVKSVSLSGTGEAAPRIGFDPPALSLGIGDDDTTATLRVTNSGGEPLTVSVIDLPDPYRLADSVGLPVEIATGSALAIDIGVVPGTRGTHAGHLTVHSNDPAVPMARIPLRAHVTDDPVALSSFPAAADGTGVGGVRWSTRASLVNPTDDAIVADLTFRPGDERADAGPDHGLEVPPHSQRVIDNLVATAGATGTGGVNLRSSGDGLIALSRTFASGPDGTYGQFIGAESHDDALAGGDRAVLVGLAGNGGFRTNLGVLNLGDVTLEVDAAFFDADGGPIGSRRITAQPGAFAQVVAIISKLTDAVVQGGYATITAVDADARYLAYASVVDDASDDPTLVLPQAIGADAAGVDRVVPIVASNPGVGGTRWRSQLSVVNTAAESRSVTLEYQPETGPSVASFPMEVGPGGTLYFDDVVGDLFGSAGKGWLRIAASDTGVFAASRTFNDNPDGTYGQLIPAVPVTDGAGTWDVLVIGGLSSANGFRTNIGLTSTAPTPTTCQIGLNRNDGSVIGSRVVELPAAGLVQLERVLGDGFGYTGDAWAEIACDPATPSIFGHASVVDGATGDPTYIPAVAVIRGE